jgi:DNA-binding response OmpR family regulator
MKLPSYFQETSKNYPKSRLSRIQRRLLEDNGAMKVLLIEDDPSIASAIVDSLDAVGWEVAHEATGISGLSRFDDEQWDVLLLDLGLPDLDGIEVTRRAREKGSCPIIVISARGEETDRVLALELGADDYLVKPFGMRELLARIRAVHRRTAVSAVSTEDSALGVGALAVDTRSRRAFLGEKELELTPKEFDVLAYLAHDPGSAHRRETILQDVWDMNWYGSTKTLDAHVAALRKKLGDARWIESVRGVGFRLQEPQ